MADLRTAFDDARHGKGVSKRAPRDRVGQLTGKDGSRTAASGRTRRSE